MSLLSFDVACRELEERFGSLNLPEFTLRPSSVDAKRIKEFQQSSGILLPNEFCNLIMRFEFRELDLKIVFGAGKGRDYLDWLYIRNTVQSGACPWWNSGTRPAEFILIGVHDAFIILLCLESGEVFAFRRGNEWKTKRLVASNCDIFIRALATYILRSEDGSNEAVLAQIMSACRSDLKQKFWDYL